MKIYSNLSNINIHYHLKLGSPPFIKISQNHDFIQTYFNDRRNSFHFACRQWYSHNNPQCGMVYIHVFEYNYSYVCRNKSKYSYTCTNTILSISRKW